MMQRHGVLAAVLKIQNHYSKIPNINPSVQKAAADVIGRLLDCNFTRNNLIDPVDASGLFLFCCVFLKSFCTYYTATQSNCSLTQQ